MEQVQRLTCPAKQHCWQHNVGAKRAGKRWGFDRVLVGCRRCLGLPAALLIFVTQAFFLAAMDPMTPLLAAALAGIVNFGGDVLLVCLLNKGIAGAAFATAVAQARPDLHTVIHLSPAANPGPSSASLDSSTESGLALSAVKTPCHSRETHSDDGSGDLLHICCGAGNAVCAVV